MEAKGGAEYAAVGALAFRQALAAIKPVWHGGRGEGWTFLKEISTDGMPHRANHTH